MNRKLFIAFAAATALTASMAGALAESAPRQAPPGAAAAPLSPTLARITRPAASPVQGAGFSALTADECKKLGGAVYTAPQCKKTGTRCVMRLPGGVINAPCIDEVR
jgi:hypothetical protein